MNSEPMPPQHVLDAVIVAAMLDHARPGRWQCDMTPVVTDWAQGPTDPEYCPDDVWWVEVRYSTRGCLASYGVDRNNVAQCYMD